MEKSKDVFLLYLTLLFLEVVVGPGCFVAAILQTGAKASRYKSYPPVGVNTIYDERWLKKYGVLRSSIHQLDSKLSEFKNFRPVAERALAEQSFSNGSNRVGKDAILNGISVYTQAMTALDYRKSTIVFLLERKLDRAKNSFQKAIQADQKSKYLQLLIMMAGVSPLNPYETVEYKNSFKGWERLKKQEKTFYSSLNIGDDYFFTTEYRNLREALDNLDDRLVKFQNFRPVVEHILEEQSYIHRINQVSKDAFLRNALTCLITCKDTNAFDLAVSTHAIEALEYRKLSLVNLQEGRFEDASTFFTQAIQADQTSRNLQLLAMMAGRSPPSPYEAVEYKNLFKEWEKNKENETKIPAPSELKLKLDALGKKQRVLEDKEMSLERDSPLPTLKDEIHGTKYDTDLETHEKKIKTLKKGAMKAVSEALWYGKGAEESFQRGNLLATFNRLEQAQIAQEKAMKGFGIINSIMVLNLFHDTPE